MTDDELKKYIGKKYLYEGQPDIGKRWAGKEIRTIINVYPPRKFINYEGKLNTDTLIEYLKEGYPYPQWILATTFERAISPGGRAKEITSDEIK